MSYENKLDKLIAVLQQFGVDGKPHGLLDVIKLADIDVQSTYEAQQLAEKLESLGYISFNPTMTGGIIMINLDLMEHSVDDMISEKEKSEIITKLDNLAERLDKLEKGQEITYDDIMDEFEEIKTLLDKLDKKTIGQLLKGKLIDMGFGAISNKVTSELIDLFGDQKLLE